MKIPNQYHAQLIGQSGRYAIRLEENYGVKITFPRSSGENGEGKTREQLKPDEVLIKGGKRGVASAKSELLDALEFEKENNKVLTFDVPTRSVSRILGKGGASILEIKDVTGAQIDVDKTNDGIGSLTQITVRGTKDAINAAKTAILAIADQVGEETTTSLVIERKFHRNIIGAGGQGLKDLISRCGGPSDTKLQAGLVRLYVCSTCILAFANIFPALAKMKPLMRFASVESPSWLTRSKRNSRKSWPRCVTVLFWLWRSLRRSTVT